MEEEFFRFVLEPHADALRAAYGMESEAIAAGIQAIADSIRTGISEAIQKIARRIDQTHELTAQTNKDMGSAIENIKATDTHFTSEMSDAMQDLLFGGICNLSRHTEFTAPLLEDLSYLPGDNTVFFAEGDFQGTPLRTLPAMVKPGIKLGEDYYITDGQFARDAAYRAIQRGLLTRTPEYREEWNRRQKVLIERSYPTIFADQLRTAARHSEVYFQDVKTGQWAESDLILVLDDILLIVEAKAGVMAMHSPATNFERHERTIRELIIKAYEQCKRFIEYIASDTEVPIYNRVDSKWVKAGKLRRDKFRKIFPIGLTVEAFTPFSAMSKELAEIEPILGEYPFISMSVDDLFVLNRFLPTAGELLHYLDVRQAVAGIPNAMLFDEIEHLGAYIGDNRFDMSIREQHKKADMVTWDSFGDVVDKYFEGNTWKTDPVPRQKVPSELAQIFEALDQYRPSGWLEMDTFLRNLGGDGRNNVARMVGELKNTLDRHPMRRFQVGEEEPLQVWLCQGRAQQPSPVEMRYHAEVGCLVVGAPKMKVLRLSYSEEGAIIRARCFAFDIPLIIQTNYGELKREADRQRARMIRLENPSLKKKRH